MAQAVRRWLPTAAAQVRSRVWSSGICGGQSGAGRVFSEYFSFPCQTSFRQLLHNHPHLSSAAGTIGQKWPTCRVDPAGLHPPLSEIKKKLEYNEVKGRVYGMRRLRLFNDPASTSGSRVKRRTRRRGLKG
jgi:hypothetical protein